jgi:hypothetical protein
MDKSVLQFEEMLPRESYDFKWSCSDEPYLTRLRTNYRLENLVANSSTDFEKLQYVSNWVHNLWKHDGNNEPQRRDPISILEEVEQGKRFRCVEYSIVINGCLNALGIPSRILSLKTADCETRESGAGHVVVESFIAEHNKWIMVDGQWDIIPTVDNVHLNAVEFQKAITENNVDLRLSSLSGNINGYLDWIFPYLYYFSCPFDNRVAVGFDFLGFQDETARSLFELMLVPRGASKPKVFQKRFPINNVAHTNSIESFYHSPLL